jgi:YHS domain-containing protein/ATP-dependent Zn protease
MNRPWFLRRWWIIPLGLVFAVVAVFTIFQSGEESRQRLALRDFVLEVEAGNVTEAELDGRIVSYRLEDEPGMVFETELARGDSITNILLDSGIPISDQPRITVDESGGVSNILTLFINFLPIIVILGIVFFFLRQAGRPQKMRWQLMGLVTNVDPVCGRSVDPGHAAGTSTFQDITYQFCTPEHKEQFDREPVRYLLQK